MAVRHTRAAVELGRRAATSASASRAEPSGAEDLLSLTDDELTALVPSTLGSSASALRSQAAPAPTTTRRTPKASGKFVTEGGRLAAPKIVKRVTKGDRAEPNKASGAYPKVTAPSSKLEDFSDLVREIESSVDVPEEPTVVISHDSFRMRPAGVPDVVVSTASVEETIGEALRAALPHMATVPLSVATIAASVSSRQAAQASDEPPAARALSREAVANVTAAPVRAAEDELRASPAPSPKRGRSVAKAVTVIAMLGAIGAGAWVAGDEWAARHRILSNAAATVAVEAPPPAPESTVAATPAPVVPATAAIVEPQAAPTAANTSLGTSVTTSTAAATTAPSKAASPTAESTAAKPTASPKAALPAAESTAAIAAAEPAKETRAASKPVRRVRASKTSDDAKANGSAQDEVDVETKRALEALQKSQLESSF